MKKYFLLIACAWAGRRAPVSKLRLPKQTRLELTTKKINPIAVFRDLSIHQDMHIGDLIVSANGNLCELEKIDHDKDRIHAVVIKRGLPTNERLVGQACFFCAFPFSVLTNEYLKLDTETIKSHWKEMAFRYHTQVHWLYLVYTIGAVFFFRFIFIAPEIIQSYWHFVAMCLMATAMLAKTIAILGEVALQFYNLNPEWKNLQSPQDHTGSNVIKAVLSFTVFVLFDRLFGYWNYFCWYLQKDVGPMMGWGFYVYTQANMLGTMLGVFLVPKGRIDFDYTRNPCQLLTKHEKMCNDDIRSIAFDYSWVDAKHLHKMFDDDVRQRCEWKTKSETFDFTM